MLKIKSLATKKQLNKNNHNTHFGKLQKFAKVGYNQLFRIFAPLINLLAKKYNEKSIIFVVWFYTNLT